MKGKSLIHIFPPGSRPVLTIFLLLIAPILGAAQSAEAVKSAANSEILQRRIERARALAAAHQLQAAASELETVRNMTGDSVVRDGTSVMLMSIYLEEGNYARAQALLEETFQARSTQKDNSVRSYFALAGQAINGVRSHLLRYRTFGVNTADADLPPEALGDLDRLRSLVERMVAQGKEITKDAPRAYDGLALLEDLLGIRLSIARDNEDRDKWQSAYVEAREKLATAQMQIASIAGVPSLVVGQSGSAERSQSQNLANAKVTQPIVKQPIESAVKPQAQAAGSAQASAEDNFSSESQTINAGLLNQRASKRVIPIYPPGAKAARVEGVVKVYVMIDENGKVLITSLDGPLPLREAAADAARGWRFPPTAIDGKPVRISGYIEFNFTL